MNDAPEKKGMQVKADDAVLKGSYSNAMQVSHTKEEFILDFMLLHPPVGQLVSRVITSPGHLKRMVAALQGNLKRYEEGFGTVTSAQEPERPIGFDTK